MYPLSKAKSRSPGKFDFSHVSRAARRSRPRQHPHPRSYVFAFTTFARSLVPLRIALALALAPWCDRNIIQKFFPPEATGDDCEVPEK